MTIIRTLDDLTALVEQGLEKWPDGKTAVCVFNQEPYEEMALGYVVDGRTTDELLMLATYQNIEALKEKRQAKFISWRKPFELIEETIEPEDIIASGQWLRDRESPVKCINQRRRVLRWRVLITAHANDEDWQNHAFMRGIQA